MRAAINNTLLKQLPSGNVEIRDTNLKGFMIRCRVSGSHAYAVEYGRSKRATLGSIHELRPAEARQEAKKILGDVAKGLDPMARKREAKAHTWKSYLDEIYAPLLTAKGTRRIGETVARLRVQFKDLERLKLKDISPWHIDKWRSARLKAGIRPATINRDTNDLRAALSRAVLWGHVTAHPLTKLKPLKTDRSAKVRYLTPNERLLLLDALVTRDERIKAERERANAWRRERGYRELRELRACRFADHLAPMVLVSLHTGLRRGELFSLAWQNVNLAGRSLTVAGETAKSQQTRHLPLNDTIFAALTAWANQSPRADGLVFPGMDGQPFDNVKKAWTKLLKDAGISNFRWHDLRHDFASRLVMAGVALNTVRELLGHASMDVTLRYSHLAPEHKSEAVQRLCEAV